MKEVRPSLAQFSPACRKPEPASITRRLSLPQARLRQVVSPPNSWVGVAAVAVVDPKATLLVVGDNGVGKRTSFDDYRSQTRGGKGIITMKTTDKTGAVAGAISVKEEDEIMLITVKGQMVRTKVKDIRESGRNTQGVYLVRLQKGDRLQGVARVVETEEDDGQLELGT